MIQLKFARHIFDDFWLDGALLFDESIDQGVFAKDIEDAGNSTRKGVQESQGVEGKNFMDGAGDAEALADIGLSLFESERRGPAANGDTLTKLAKFVALEFFFKLGLTRKNDLKKIVGGRFEIQKEPDRRARSRGAGRPRRGRCSSGQGTRQRARQEPRRDVHLQGDV